ncbi:MAG: hypothetical protein ABSE72_03455 [Bacteroidales bacterium]
MNLKNNVIRNLVSKGKVDWIIFIPLFFLCLYLAYDINFSHRQNHQPEIYSDKADYYVYLPATFIYGWDIHKFPAGIEKKCMAFHLDYENNKLADKTTCGIAILWTPFFLITHFIAVHWNLQPDGFSDFYQKMTILPGVFYLLLGLFFLMKFLRNYFSRGVSYITVFLIFAGTNLYYFGIDDGLMSHVNSFFLFALFLFFLKKFLNQEKKSFALFIGICFVLSLAILIRPTNILLFTWMIFLDITSLKALWKRILLFLKPAYIITFIITVSLVFLPQFIYWKYLTGHFLYYSYPGEGFLNWKNPLMIAVWFSPLNGFFLYTPLALLFIAGIIIMIMKKIPNGIFIGLFFLLITYIFASWHIWYFGGSFGYRPFVEYYSLLALPFGYFLASLKAMKNLYIRSLLILFIIISGYYNLRLTYHQKWNPYSTWAWDDYFIYLDEAGICHYNPDSYTYKQDFENFGGVAQLSPQRECVHSPGIAGYINEDILTNGPFLRRLDGMLHAPVKRVKASLWVNPGKKIRTKALFVCKIQDWQQKIFYYKEIKLDDFIKKPNTWTKVTAIFTIPEWIDQSNNICFYVWNKSRTSMTYIDDIKLRFEKQ